MRILVVGAGSVGLGMASCLLKSGHRVAIAGRPVTCQALAARRFSIACGDSARGGAAP